MRDAPAALAAGAAHDTRETASLARPEAAELGLDMHCLRNAILHNGLPREPADDRS
jgi:hypothetical protein